jgi:hypothetical protein
MRYLFTAIILTFLVTPVIARAYEGEITDAWSYGHDSPLSRTPQQLISGAMQYSEHDRELIQVEDSYWVLKPTVGEDYLYHYILFYWDYKNNWATVNFRWRVYVGGGAKIKLYYWNQSSWVYITENAGGMPAPGVTTDVTNYYNGTNLILLAVGGTKEDNNYTACDIGRLRGD